MTLLVAFLVLGQKSPSELVELRKYRYGKPAGAVETMGRDGFAKFFQTKTPDYDTGPMRGVADGVYVDAYRENTARRYRPAFLPKEQSRLLALDKQIRFLGVLFARNDWLFSGGNAFNPEDDALEYAQTERQLYTRAYEVADRARMRKRLATYRAEILSKARRERLYGTAPTQAEGRRQLEANLTKIEGAERKAEALCRSPRERAILYRFVADQAIARM